MMSLLETALALAAAWLQVKGYKQVPVRLTLAVESDNSEARISAARIKTHTGRNTHCQEAGLPINQLVSRSSTHHSEPSLICKPMQSSNDAIRLALAHTRTGSCMGKVNEVAHCDEWMSEGLSLV